MSADIIDISHETFRGNNFIARSSDPSFEGAKAALDTFYFAFNNRQLELLDKIWKKDALIQLDNPLGGIKRGAQHIHDLYARIIQGSVLVRVNFTDAIAYVTPNMVIFAGREIGTYTLNGTAKDLTIRTTRVFTYDIKQGGWRQVHHHGSIDDADLLEDYQQSISRNH